MELLTNERISLRALEPEDLEILYKWENDTRIWKMSNTVAPFSRYTLRRFIENQGCDIYETKQLRMVIVARRDGRAVGAIDLFDIDPTNRRAGVGILVYEDRDQGQGYASGALTAMIRYAFQVLGLNQLYCNVLSSNMRSLNLFKSKGFKTVGLKVEWVRSTDGWLDEYMLQLINPVKM